MQCVLALCTPQKLTEPSDIVEEDLCCGLPLLTGVRGSSSSSARVVTLQQQISIILVFMCRQESIRTAFLLSQGGEFAFVLLSLANELKVLPTDLNRLLIIVVVLSMALTPFLAEAGKRFAESTIEDDSDGKTSTLFQMRRK